MGLREDFRNALGSIADAMPDATHRLRHGENEQGPVVQSRSRDFAETVSETEPAEVTRVIANAGLFPTLDDGEAVELDGSLRVVTSLKTDPIGATFTVGLSAEFEKTPATYRGTRRENGSRREIIHPLDVLTLENGTADNFADALAPTYATAYVVAIRREDWPEVTNPEPSDTIEIAKDGYAVALKVSTATRHDGWFILKCRTRG